jgi:hypothetical protein
MATVKIWTGAAWEDIDSTTPLPVATASILGGVKIGSGVTVAADGTISVSAPPAATVAPSNLAATAAVGTATAYARADHVHKLPTAAEVGALTQTDADARYVNLTGDAMTGTLTTTGRIGVGTAPPSRPLHVLNSTGIFAARFQTTSAYACAVEIAGVTRTWEVSVGGPTTDSTIDGGFYIYEQLSGPEAPGLPRLSISPGGNVGIGRVNPVHRLDVNGVARASGLTLDSTATDGAHFAIAEAGISVWRGPWGTGDGMGSWLETGLEHYSDSTQSLVGSFCAHAASAGIVRATHVSSGSIILSAWGNHNHYLYSDSNQGTFGIGTSSNKDLSLYTANVSRLLMTKDGAFSATIGNGTALYPSFLPRAWVHFNAAKTILASGNVSSVASGGVGIATITLATAMPDANFAVHAQANNPDCFASAQVLSSSQVRVWIWRWTGAAWQYSDQPCMVSIIR